MSELAEFEKRKRHLPHWEEPGATYFVTFCLKRGVSVNLTRPEVGRFIIDALRFFDEKRYWLYDYRKCLVVRRRQRLPVVVCLLRSICYHRQDVRCR